MEDYERGLIKALSIFEANHDEVIYLDFLELLRFFVLLITELCVPQCSDQSFETTFKVFSIFFSISLMFTISFSLKSA